MAVAKKILHSDSDLRTSSRSGFDLESAQGASWSVKLRRSLRAEHPLGVTICVRESARIQRIDQFDILPSLDAMTRSLVEGMILEAFALLKNIDTFERGVERLERMKQEGFCERCSFEPVRR